MCGQNFSDTLYTKTWVEILKNTLSLNFALSLSPVIG